MLVVSANQFDRLARNHLHRRLYTALLQVMSETYREALPAFQALDVFWSGQRWKPYDTEHDVAVRLVFLWFISLQPPPPEVLRRIDDAATPLDERVFLMKSCLVARGVLDFGAFDGTYDAMQQHHGM
jgi:hypothetical protein